MVADSARHAMAVDAKPVFAMLVGNIGSGKSSLAKQIVLFDKEIVVVNRDAIVTMIAGGIYKNYDMRKRPIYLQVESTLILAALQAGFGVILDRTNESVKKRKKYIDLVRPPWSGHQVVIRCYDFGPGTEAGMLRRMANNRGRDPEEWRAVHGEIAAGYEQPQLEEGIDEVIYCGE